ncbi:hypothetical protein Gohar_018564 [Gossypium harknessii]|uniref:Uncharacterized protein n=1 Tax=Gossypium harknessii TaxID=34285 RepID=A0A7J9GAR9_9ROSI|nr:hypothetical protein [Gossypium harknessii]
METLGAGTLGPKDGKNSGKDNIGRGGRKPSNTLRGWESHFKFSGNFRIPLAESIEVVVELLSFQVSSEAGCANVKFPQVFRKYNMEYKPDIISLLEPRDERFNRVVFSVILKLTSAECGLASN